MVGAFAISAVPLFSGFVSKSMVVSAAGESHRAAIFLVLTLASAGTFLHTGLKLPYYMFFGKDRGLRAHEPPANMLVAMGLAAAACVLIGVFPALLYAQLPYPVEYAPYTVRHVTGDAGAAGLHGARVLRCCSSTWIPSPTISLDTDWFYRRGLSAAMAYAFVGLGARGERSSGRSTRASMRRPAAGRRSAAAPGRRVCRDRAAVGVGHLTDA